MADDECPNDEINVTEEEGRVRGLINAARVVREVLTAKMKYNPLMKDHFQAVRDYLGNGLEAGNRLDLGMGRDEDFAVLADFYKTFHELGGRLPTPEAAYKFGIYRTILDEVAAGREFPVGLVIGDLAFACSSIEACYRDKLRWLAVPAQGAI